MTYHTVPLLLMGWIFSRGGQFRGLGTKVPQRSPGMEPRWGHATVSTKPPEADDGL